MCVTDVDVAVTNLRVVCKIVMYVRFSFHMHNSDYCLTVCVRVFDGCGRGHNEFAGRVHAKTSRAFQKWLY